MSPTPDTEEKTLEEIFSTFRKSFVESWEKTKSHFKKQLQHPKYVKNQKRLDGRRWK